MTIVEVEVPVFIVDELAIAVPEIPVLITGEVIVGAENVPPVTVFPENVRAEGSDSVHVLFVKGLALQLKKLSHLQFRQLLLFACLVFCIKLCLNCRGYTFDTREFSQ